MPGWIGCLAAHPQMQVNRHHPGHRTIAICPAGLEEEMTPGKHRGGQVDPHIWLSPQLVKASGQNTLQYPEPVKP